MIVLFLKYSATVDIQMFGHFHTDDFRVFFSRGALLVCGGMVVWREERELNGMR